VWWYGDAKHKRHGDALVNAAVKVAAPPELTNDHWAGIIADTLAKVHLLTSEQQKVTALPFRVPDGGVLFKFAWLQANLARRVERIDRPTLIKVLNEMRVERRSLGSKNDKRNVHYLPPDVMDGAGGDTEGGIRI